MAHFLDTWSRNPGGSYHILEVPQATCLCQTPLGNHQQGASVHLNHPSSRDVIMRHCAMMAHTCHENGMCSSEWKTRQQVFLGWVFGGRGFRLRFHDTPMRRHCPLRAPVAARTLKQCTVSGPVQGLPASQ